MSRWLMVDGLAYTAYRSEKSGKPIVLIDTYHLPLVDIEYAYSCFKMLYQRDYRRNHPGENDYLSDADMSFATRVRDWLDKEFIKEKKRCSHDGLMRGNNMVSIEVCVEGEFKDDSKKVRQCRYWVGVGLAKDYWIMDPLFFFNSREMSEEATDKMVEWAIEMLNRDLECRGEKNKAARVSYGRGEKRYEYLVNPYNLEEIKND